MSSQDRIKRLSYSAIFTALAIIFGYIEFLFPLPVPIPGIKVGIANLVILVAIYRFNFKAAFSINMIRILVSGLLFSGVFGMIYSFSGGILSMITMFLLYRTDKFSIVGVSMAGGVIHNLGQLLSAIILLNTKSLLSYTPVLLFSGIISGIIIGIIGYLILRRLPSDFKF